MKKYKSKYKKAARGLQDVAVPEQGSNSDVLSSTTSMASAGAQFGPWGAAIGGITGLGVGLLNKNKQDAANRQAIASNKTMALNRSVDGVDESVDQKVQRFQKGGKVNTKTIEIEGKKTPEIHTDKNFNVKNLGSIPHSKGGNKVEASEGDIVFNTQNSLAKYNKIASAISTGDVATLKKEKNKLPEDSGVKNQDGNRQVSPPDRKPRTKKILEEDKLLKGLNWLSDNFVPAIYNTGAAYRAQRDKNVDNTPAKEIIKTNALTAKPISKQEGLDFLNTQGIKSTVKPVTSTVAKTTPTKTSKPTTRIKGTKAPAPVIPTVNPLTKFVAGTDNPNISPLEGLGSDGRKLPAYTPGIQNTPTVPLSTSPQTSSSTDYNNTQGLTPEQIKEAAIKKAKKDKIDKILNTGMQFAGVANNLFQGLKSEKPISEKYFDPELNKYVDRSQNLRNLSTNAAAIQTSNARNVSGGNTSNIRANQTQASLADLQRQGSIDEQEMARRDAIEASNTGLKNAAGQYNLQRKDMYQGQIDGNRAAKTAYMDQAAVDIGKIGNARQQETYMRSRDDKALAAEEAGRRAMNGSSKFQYNRDGTYNFNADEDNATSNRFSATSLFPLPQTNTRTRRKPGVYNKGTKYIKKSK